MSSSDASSETNEFNCKTSFTAQFYQRRYASRSPVSSDPHHVRCTAEVDRESSPSHPSVNHHSDAAHCCFKSDGISQGQEQRVIHFVLSPGPQCCCHLLHYLCCQVFHYISCHLFCNSRNLWRLQRPGWAWDLMGTGAIGWAFPYNIISSPECKEEKVSTAQISCPFNFKQRLGVGQMSFKVYGSAPSVNIFLY